MGAAHVSQADVVGFPERATHDVGGIAPAVGDGGRHDFLQHERGVAWGGVRIEPAGAGGAPR